MGFEEPGIAFDEYLITHVGGTVADHPVDEGIAQILHMAHGLFTIQGERLVSFHPVASKNAAAVEILGDLNQRLGRHAADPGAGGALFAAIDQNKAFSGGLDPTQGIESGTAGADYGDINISLFHCNTLP
jgi:hypothetical protein